MLQLQQQQQQQEKQQPVARPHLYNLQQAAVGISAHTHVTSESVVGYCSGRV
jgi:hypothetical protein